MNKTLYIRLALTNIRKNGKTYYPFILASTGTIMMFYIIHFISKNNGLNKMAGSNDLKIIMNLGTWVIGIFSVIFLFYTNSFLIRRRKKELGLYNILGMEKMHIARVLFWETLLAASVSIIAGLLGGILLSRLMFLIMLKILSFEVTLTYAVSPQSLAITAVLFTAIFTLTLLNNLRQIHLAKPVELLRGEQFGEKEPKTKRLTALIGIICLGTGYYLALTTESPLKALFIFFVAVILVIIGTYALFTAGSIAMLKLLKNNKRFYYHPRHFISISGMIYRMKQNAVGLSNICILSTAVLVMVSTTVSLYIGMEDVLRTRFSRDIAVSAKNVSDEKAELLDGIIQEEVGNRNISMQNIVKYRYMSFVMKQDRNSFSPDADGTVAGDNYCVLELIPLSEYNFLEGCSETLGKDEVILFDPEDKIPADNIIISNNRFRIKYRLSSLAINDDLSSSIINSYYIIVPDVQTIEAIYASSIKTNDGGVMNDAGNGNQNSYDMGALSYYYAFDSDSDAKNQIALVHAIHKRLKAESIDGFAEGVEISKDSFFSLHGGLFFLGIFLGALFMMATVLIIYYKQISEGYDDKGRFEIMQQVGMSREEVKKSIHSQVLMVFFLPLVMTVVHIAFAFKVITKLLAILNLTNIALFALCTVGTILVFTVFYAIVYYLTAQVYYRIVS